MIRLQPNRIYKLSYSDGIAYKRGANIYFQTLDHVPEAKHLIRVKECTTGQIVELIELLAHPWEYLQEHLGEIPRVAENHC